MKRKGKRYALLQNHPEHGIIAMIDYGMRMNWSHTHAYLWSRPPYHYWRKGYFIVRMGSKNCPIKLEKRRTKNNKFIKV